MKNKRRVILYILVGILCIVMLCPFKSVQYDGIQYRAVLYRIVCVHKEKIAETITGTQVYILGVKVFDNTETEIHYEYIRDESFVNAGT